MITLTDFFVTVKARRRNKSFQCSAGKRPKHYYRTQISRTEEPSTWQIYKILVLKEMNEITQLLSTNVR